LREVPGIEGRLWAEIAIPEPGYMRSLSFSPPVPTWEKPLLSGIKGGAPGAGECVLYTGTMRNGGWKSILTWLEAAFRKPWLPSALLSLCTLVLYAPMVHHGFLNFDDAEYILQNPHVNTGLSVDNFIWAFTSFYSANWHPVTWLSHMVDCQLFGLNAGAHHAVSLALHAVNVVLLFLLLRSGTRAPLRSFLVAALFAVHPLNVETVAWVAERKSLLCMLFSLLTVAAYGRYCRLPKGTRYLAVVIAYALALMSKPMAVTMPAVLLLLDYWPLRRLQELPFRQRWLRLAIEKIPLFLLTVASVAVTMLGQRAGGAITEQDVLPLLVRVQNVPGAYLAYLGKMFLPRRLSVYYPNLLEGTSSLPWAQVIACTAVMTALTAAVLYLRHRRYLVTGWFLFLGTLVPVIGVVQVGHQAMADRYTYLPFIGLFIMLAWGAADLAEAARVPRAVLLGALLCSVVVFGIAARHYLACWQDGVTLFTQARKVAAKPDPLIENALADSLGAAGRTDEALQHYRLSCELYPGNPFCHFSIARILFDRKEYSEAIAECHTVARLAYGREPQLAIGCLNKSGAVMMDLGAFDGAERDFTAALMLDPGNQTARSLLEETRRRRERIP
jgi:hypothetical protein